MLAAAARLRVAPSTAYYWMKARARTGGERAPAFARLVPSSEVGMALAVRVGGAEIQVRDGFDAELLRAVVEALGNGAA